MTAHTKGTGLKWVGRAIRRLEDPALVTGQGRFTADLPAAHWVRFVRSPIAAGKIAKIDAPKGAMVITAADLKGVKKITPMLHKFNYKPVGQPILADGVVRFVGEPVAAVVAASEEEAEDIADLVEVDIDETTPVIDARAALEAGRAAGARRGARQRHPRRQVQDAGLRRGLERRGQDHQGRRALAPAERHADGSARRPRRLRRLDRPRHADLHHADAASDAHRDRRRARHAGIRSARDRARCRRRLRPEDVARRRICRAGLAGAQTQSFGGLDRGPAREPDRRLSRARPVHHAGRRLRQERQAARAARRHRLQHRRLFLLPDHLRRRAADGDGGNAGAL